jgi:ankyrin repeat protein
VDVNIQDEDGLTVLHYSAETGHEAVVIKLLEAPNVDVNIQDENGWTALHYSAKRCHETVVIKILEAPNVNVNVVTRQHENALRLAVREDYVSMVKILATNQQLQVTQENLDGETPFQIAFEMKKPNSKSYFGKENYVIIKIFGGFGQIFSFLLLKLLYLVIRLPNM